MAYNVDTFSGDRTIVIEDGTIDSTFSLRLVGKNYAGFGEIQNENYLHLLENFANDTAPPRPINGQIWYDSSTKKIRYYDSSAQRWRATGGVEVGASTPIVSSEGDLWWKTDVQQLYIKSFAEWVPIISIPNNTENNRKILSQTAGNAPEWIILPTVLPIARSDGSILNIPLTNGSFSVQKRDSTLVNITVN